MWYQLYVVGGREVAEAAVERARLAGFSVLVVTIDTSALGNRERDLRNGVKQLTSGNPFKALPHLPQLLAHPRWLAGFVRDGRPLKLPNIVIPRPRAAFALGSA